MSGQDRFALVAALDQVLTAKGSDPRLWDLLEESGFTRVGLPEEAGGSGGDLQDAAEVVRAAGRHSSSVPVAEALLVAGWLAATAGLALEPGLLTAGHGKLTATRTDEGWAVRGLLPRVAHARDAVSVAAVALTDDGTEVAVLLPASRYAVTAGASLAGEPRDDVLVDLALTAEHAAEVPVGTREALFLRGALSRALLTCGALTTVQDGTVRYVSERVQFGRPLAAFQAVQHQVAQLAEEVAAAVCATDAALDRVDVCGPDDPDAQWAVAAAKVRTAQAATRVGVLAHQAHGAMGMTQEHPLQLSTTRLWSWRSEWGDEALWSTRLGEAALRAGEDGLWPLLVGT